MISSNQKVRDELYNFLLLISMDILKYSLKTLKLTTLLLLYKFEY